MAWVDGYADPVVKPVFGWGPPAHDDVTRAEMTGTVSLLDVYAREPFCSHGDVLVIQGLEYTVQGDPADYRFGPFGFAPGVRVRCRRSEG